MQTHGALGGRVSGGRVVVLGAAGHTAAFVVAELRRRGFTPVLAGRDEARLEAVAAAHPGCEVWVASADEPAALDRALAGAAAVVNCAGPFGDTSAPVVEAALRARAHYLDVSAEQAPTIDVFARYGDAARDAGIVVAPSVAFYGALGDLLATAAMGDWPDADAVEIGIALDSWLPTRGTRLTVQQNAGKHVVFADGRLQVPGEPRTILWDFAAPAGTQEVTELSTADQVTIPRHLRVREVRAYMTLAPLRDLRDPDTPAPVPADERGRSAQTFQVDVRVRRGGEARRASASGRDIYAVTGPIVAEAVERILDGRHSRAGVAAAGEIFDAGDFLRALSPEHIELRL
ncbi:MAG TPA: saccharopine dehydrogenase NADP-binding domain-containing protein [Longimicrobium sp.]|nr:saccharopine dehydrogenase NADP-binding domain-containing protein [Longimicrobium sp.]